MGFGLHLEFLGSQIRRVRFERCQHAVDSRLDQFRIIRLVDVIEAHMSDHISKNIEITVEL